MPAETFSKCKRIISVAIAAITISSLLHNFKSTLSLQDVYTNLVSVSSQTMMTMIEEEEGLQSTKEHNNPDDFKDMNIVLFYADDWTWRTLGFVNKVVKTPNIDSLARNGISFLHNCVTTSICWQSRATKSTGMYVSVHQQLRIWDDNIFDKTVKWRQTLYPQLFANGYNVGFIGKWHALTPKEHLAYTFDHFNNYWGHHWRNRKGKLRHVTDLNKEDAINFLRLVHNEWNDVNATSKKEKEIKKKFALTVSFFATHAWDGKQYPDQYMPDNYTEYLYTNTTIPVPQTATEEAWQKMPWFFTEHNEGRQRWRLRFDTPDHYQVSMKRLYRMASEVDDAVGAVVQELKDMGVYNNTVIIFTTDNGNFHGEHGLADKWYPYEESIRVPLIIQDPRMPSHLRGSTNDEFTLNIDLAPTLLKMAGIDVPKLMQGRNIADLYLGDYLAAATNWRKDFFYEWSQGRPEDAKGHTKTARIPAVFALVQKEFKYFYWPEYGFEQLFHVAVDPFEEHDVLNTTNSTKIDEIKSRYRELKNLSQQGYKV